MIWTPLDQKDSVKNIFALASYLSDLFTGILDAVTKPSPASQKDMLHSSF